MELPDVWETHNTSDKITGHTMKCQQGDSQGLMGQVGVSV